MEQKGGGNVRGGSAGESWGKEEALSECCSLPQRKSKEKDSEFLGLANCRKANTWRHERKIRASFSNVFYVDSSGLIRV